MNQAAGLRRIERRLELLLPADELAALKAEEAREEEIRSAFWREYVAKLREVQDSHRAGLEVRARERRQLSAAREAGIAIDRQRKTRAMLMLLAFSALMIVTAKLV